MSWESAEVADILRDQLTLDGDADRLSCAGPQARVDAPSSLALALVLHELGTNARKYGALSVPNGELTITLEIDGDHGAPQLNLEWVECGGPRVYKPEIRGFGTALIAHSLKGVSGNTELRFDPEGLSCTIRLPLVPAGNGAPAR
jgi:two-component sensor histidine kinase